MFYQEYAPAVPLRPFIKTYAIYEDDREDENGISEWLPPFLTKGIIFFYRLDQIIASNEAMADRLMPMGYVLPQAEHSTKWSFNKGFGSFAVLFNPGKFRYFFKVPMFEFLNQPIDIQDFEDKSLLELHEQVYEARSSEEKVAAADACLLRKLTRIDREVDIIDEGLKDLFINPNITLPDFKSKFRISERHFRRKFQAEIGIGLKHYQRQIRFLRALRVLDSLQFKTLSEVAHQCGYYDHSQFNKEFKSYLHITPSQYLAFRFPLAESIYWRE